MADDGSRLFADNGLCTAFAKTSWAETDCQVRFARYHQFRSIMKQARCVHAEQTFPVTNPLVPVAQYVRMSDEKQQYSIDNQRAAITS